jgi:hypothetical protein
MTVLQLTQRLTQEELIGWAAYYEIKGEEEEKVMDRSRVSSRAQTMTKR